MQHHKTFLELFVVLWGLSYSALLVHLFVSHPSVFVSTFSVYVQRHGISTGRLEGFNNRIKVSKRGGYGCRNEDYFFTLVRYLSIPFVRGSSSRKT